jgi:mono/diheme cytochrome c family protein
MRKFGIAVVVVTAALAQAGIRASSAKASVPEAAQNGAAPTSPPNCAAISSAAPTRASAHGPAGNPESGKMIWALGNTSCRNCHGGDAEGAFAPTLAGQKFPFDAVKNQIRKPCGIMPAYIPSQLTDQEVADLVAYWNSLPAPAKPAAWRTPLPAGAAPGQLLAIQQIGCAQCHGATLDTPRHGLAQVNGDWEWFKRQVYEHQTAIRTHWAQLDPSLPQVTPGPAGPPGRNRVRMGHYDRKQLPEPVLRQIFDWASDLGYLPPLAAQVMAGAQANAYTVKVINAGVKNKGIAAEGVNVSVILPASANVVSTTGTGYQGTQPLDNTSKVAVWRLPRLGPTEQEMLTITLSAPAPDLHGTIRWAKPEVKADPLVLFALRRGAQASN